MRTVVLVAIFALAGCDDERTPPEKERAEGRGAPKSDEPSFPTLVTAAMETCGGCKRGDDGTCEASYRFACGDDGLCGREIPCEDTCCGEAAKVAAKSVAIVAPGSEVYASRSSLAPAMAKLSGDAPGVVVRRLAPPDRGFVRVETVGRIPQECTAVDHELERLEVAFTVQASDLSPAPVACAVKIVETRSRVDTPVGDAEGADRYIRPWTTLAWNDRELDVAGRSIGPIPIPAQTEVQQRGDDQCCVPLPGTTGPGICAPCSAIAGR